MHPAAYVIEMRSMRFGISDAADPEVLNATRVGVNTVSRAVGLMAMPGNADSAVNMIGEGAANMNPAEGAYNVIRS
ncbi:MAG: hypothetical protein F4X97_00470 [Boseongicola sp. SB0662_bin_57]|nr:hypothetical protein [Boseongicola sp. SB0662_bin_57]